MALRWGEVSALLVRPTEPRAMLAFAHGAGAGIEHPFMADMAQRLAGQGIASFRYHFPYMEARALSGRRRPPDRPPVLVETVRAAVAKAARLADGLLLLAGGKSMGGRMTSTAAAEDPLPGVAGLVFFGFPLHAPGRPGARRRTVGAPEPGHRSHALSAGDPGRSRPPRSHRGDLRLAGAACHPASARGRRSFLPRPQAQRTHR